MTNVLGSLGAAVKSGPQKNSKHSRYAKGTCVMAQPRKVQCNFDTKIFGNIVQRLGSKQFPHPVQLQFTQCRRFVQRKQLNDYTTFLPSSNCEYKVTNCGRPA